MCICWCCCFSFSLWFMGRIVPVKRVRSIWRTSSNASRNVREGYFLSAVCSLLCCTRTPTERAIAYALTHSHTRARARSPVRANVNTNERPRNNNGFVSPHTHTHTRNNKVLLHRMFRHSTHTAAPCLFDGGVDFSRVSTRQLTHHTLAHTCTHTHTRAQGGRGVEYISQCTHRAAYA